MGLFENLGRKVEEFKQEAVAASEGEAARECASCGELIYTDREDCPECGSEQVVARTTTDGEESGVAEGSSAPAESGVADGSETDADAADATDAEDESPPDPSD